MPPLALALQRQVRSPSLRARLSPASRVNPIHCKIEHITLAGGGGGEVPIDTSAERYGMITVQRFSCR
jgi:hypothetical protein